MLRELATAYVLKKGNIFQIRAYENAATSIENLTSEVQDLWEEGKLDEIPGVGKNIHEYLDELFKTGKVRHWEEMKSGIEKGVFEFLDIPGVGPMTAMKLSQLGVRDRKDLINKLRSGELIEKGFSEKIAEKLTFELRRRPSVKEGRMLLPYAFTQAEKILAYLKKCPDIEKADVLGSLRRMVATVGDLDFAVASKKPDKTVEHIASMPGIVQVVDKGEAKVRVKIASGVQLDFLIADPASYGALLQHFTGSKAHNIHLRSLAQKKGLSLSEYGVRMVDEGKIIKCETEDDFYKMLGMETPEPEIREDTGEIEAAQAHKLPKLVELKDIKGDLHTHSDFPIDPSHDLGASSPEEMVKEAKRLGYAYFGLSEHQPSVANHTPEQMVELVRRKLKLIEQLNYSEDIRVLNLLEVDITPDGSFSLPEDGFKLLDFALVGVHSVHNMGKVEMTERILKALNHPKVKVLTHPTGRILLERDSFDADWPRIFEFAGKNKKAMEISAFPSRLDLSDVLIREAKKYGVKFVINTDSHRVDQMENMMFGVSMGRRGWLTKDDVINTWDWKKFAEWFNI